MAFTPLPRPQSPHKLGWFEVTQELIEFGWEDMLPIMSNFVVVRAEQRYDTQTVRYLAYSPLFTIVDRVSQAPWYQIVCHRTEDGGITVTANVINKLTPAECDNAPPTDRRRIRVIER